MTHMVPNNQITLLQNGEAYFPALEAALDRAIQEIYLETYIFEDDTTGRHIAKALMRAAVRSVKTLDAAAPAIAPPAPQNRGRGPGDRICRRHQYYRQYGTFMVKPRRALTMR